MSTLKVLSSSSSKFAWATKLRRQRASGPAASAPSSALANRWSFVDPQQSHWPDHFWEGYELRFLNERGELPGIWRVLSHLSGGQFEIQGDALPTSEDLFVLYELFSPEPSPLFAIRSHLELPLSAPLPQLEMYLGTTRGTNALLTRQGARTALITTAHLGDVLAIGEQNRPDLFALTIRKARPLYERVIEVDERVAADGTVLKGIDRQAVFERLQAARKDGLESVAICLLHGYRYPDHEQAIAEIASAVGFEEVSTSSKVAPLIKLVPRAETTVLDAYLNPIIRGYADRIRAQLVAGSTLHLMTSSGSLVTRDRFCGKDSVLSGPAGGVVGFARIAEQAGFAKAIGFDMGGTSTDVSRFDGRFEMEFESNKAGVRIVTPLLAVETVAAGGGSICDLAGGRLTVGPESASSLPGPACYGRGGPLAVTDINVFLGRISSSQFPFPLDRAAIDRRLDELRERLRLVTGQSLSRVELATGYLEIANQNMASAIRTVSVSRGYDPRDYLLVAFGGAGPQHATAVARLLGMRHVLVHPHSSVLSALGIRLADRGAFGVRSVLQTWGKDPLAQLEPLFSELTQEAMAELMQEGLPRNRIVVRRTLDLRFSGTDSFLNIDADDLDSVPDQFLAQHRQWFGYIQDRDIEVVAARIEALVLSDRLPVAGPTGQHRQATTNAQQEMHLGQEPAVVPLFDWARLKPGDRLLGPALIADEMTTTVLDDGWSAEVLSARQLLLVDNRQPTLSAANPADSSNADIEGPDPVQLEIFNNQFASIARQMGITLQRTSISVNVKDRLDFSCALFDSAGNLVVNAPHIPVHLGSMSETVRALIRDNPDVVDGDVLVTNDPFAGGSHLPDVTVATPVFHEGKLVFWVASRSHHAEIGGKTPGSMPPDASCLADEGVVLQNFKLISAGTEHFDELARQLAVARYPSRRISDNLADVRAQVAANRSGSLALQGLVRQRSLSTVSQYMQFVQDAAETQVREALKQIEDGTYAFEDSLDNGRTIRVAIEKVSDCIRIDFSGTDPVSPDNLNANRAICLAAIMYTMRCLLKTDMPLNEGVIRPVTLVLPECFLNPRPGPDPEHSPAMVGGNVETSQRIVDVLWGALGLAAASQGTMNNWLMGDSSFGYYETLGGGSGGSAEGAGADAVHCHMSNTRLTDPEVLETRYPVRLVSWRIESGTGGSGLHPGGCGMHRCIEFLKPLTVSLLTSRRNSRPYGILGGAEGASGRNVLQRFGQAAENLPYRAQREVQPGDRLTLITPGGGGWGPSET